MASIALGHHIKVVVLDGAQALRNMTNLLYETAVCVVQSDTVAAVSTAGVLVAKTSLAGTAMMTKLAAQYSINATSVAVKLSCELVAYTVNDGLLAGTQNRLVAIAIIFVLGLAATGISRHRRRHQRGSGPAMG